jgi:hypothetical protein
MQEFHRDISELVKALELSLIDHFGERACRLGDSQLEIFIIELAGIQMLELLIPPLHQVVNV